MLVNGENRSPHQVRRSLENGDLIVSLDWWIEFLRSSFPRHYASQQPERGTDAMPGTEAKLQVLEQRAAQQENLFLACDPQWTHNGDTYRGTVDPHGNLKILFHFHANGNGHS
jgi:hypothetical protein